MNIDFKGPRGFIFDISSLNEVLGSEGVFSPLAAQYVVERSLVENLGLSVVSDIPQYPSLRDQYRQIKFLMSWYGLEVHKKIPKNIVGMLREFVISVVMNDDILLICLQKPITRSNSCGQSVFPFPT